MVSCRKGQEWGGVRVGWGGGRGRRWSLVRPLRGPLMGVRAATVDAAVVVVVVVVVISYRKGQD